MWESETCLDPSLYAISTSEVNAVYSGPILHLLWKTAQFFFLRTPADKPWTNRRWKNSLLCRGWCMDLDEKNQVLIVWQMFFFFFSTWKNTSFSLFCAMYPIYLFAVKTIQHFSQQCTLMWYWMFQLPVVWYSNYTVSNNNEYLKK